MTTAQEIGIRIKKLREDRNWSQEELAARLGYKSRSSVNKIELGQRNLTQSKIKAIADALDTTPAYIMGWTSDDPITHADPDLFAQILMDRVMTDHVQTLQTLTYDHKGQVYDLIDILHQREQSGDD